MWMIMHLISNISLSAAPTPFTTMLGFTPTMVKETLNVEPDLAKAAVTEGREISLHATHKFAYHGCLPVEFESCNF